MIHWRVRKALYFALSAGSWFACVWSNGNWAFVILFLGLLMAGLNVLPYDRAIRKDSEQLEELDAAMSDLEHEVDRLGSWLEEPTHAILVRHACSDDEMVWDDISDQYEWVCPHLGLLYC